MCKFAEIKNIMNTDNFSIKYPEYFKTIQEEKEFFYKGFISDIEISYKGEKYMLNFFSLSRIEQDFKSILEFGGFCFSERNLIIVKDITKNNIYNSIKYIVNTFGDLNNSFLNLSQCISLIGHELVEKLIDDYKCPIGNYILFANGDMLNFEYYFIEDKFHFRILNKSTIESYFEFNEKDYVSCFDGLFRFKNEEYSVFAGEGSYGSDGALWVIENKTNKLLWFLFSDRSNPFVSASINENKEVVAKTNLGKIWKIPLLQSEISNKNKQNASA